MNRCVSCLVVLALLWAPVSPVSAMPPSSVGDSPAAVFSEQALLRGDVFFIRRAFDHSMKRVVALYRRFWPSRKKPDLESPAEEPGTAPETLESKTLIIRTHDLRETIRGLMWIDPTMKIQLATLNEPHSLRNLSVIAKRVAPILLAKGFALEAIPVFVVRVVWFRARISPRFGIQPITRKYETRSTRQKTLDQFWRRALRAMPLSWPAFAVQFVQAAEHSHLVIRLTHQEKFAGILRFSLAMAASSPAAYQGENAAIALVRLWEIVSSGRFQKRLLEGERVVIREHVLRNRPMQQIATRVAPNDSRVSQLRYRLIGRLHNLFLSIKLLVDDGFTHFHLPTEDPETLRVEAYLDRGLSNTAVNALLSAKIKTLGELHEVLIFQRRQIPRMGEKAESEARALLFAVGLTHTPDTPDLTLEEWQRVPEGERGNIPLSRLPIKTLAFNALANAKIQTVEDLATQLSEGKRIKGIGPKSRAELHALLIAG